MGYSIDDTNLKNRYIAREPQICNIRVDFLDRTMQPGNKTYIILTDKDIVLQGLNIDRALFTGNTLELGTAISAECTLTLNNSDGKFNDFHFEGAKLQIYVGLKSDGRSSDVGTEGGRVTSVDGDNVTVETIRKIVNAVPMGTFWVDNCPRRAKKITLQCLDSFAKMDIVIPSSGHGISTNNIELHEMISQICSKFGLTLYATSGESFSTYLQSLFPNTYNKQVTLPQIDGKLTYRALFQYCIQMLGGYAFMDWGNKVHIAKYGSSAVSPTITTDIRYTSDIQENSISITGVSITYKDDEDVEHTSLDGTTDYAISMSGNPLINVENVSNLAHSIRSQTFGSWYYYPFSVKCKPMIWLYPLDKVAIKNQSGTSVTSYVTNTNFTLNGAMVLESKGETRYEKGWASSNAFTAQQTAIIEGLAKQDTSDLRQKYQDVLNLNELLAKSMGLWTKQISGVYYFYSVYGSSATTPPPMTGVDLSYGSHVGKDVIYTFGSNGFGWSTSFNGTITTQAQRNALNTEEKIIEKLVWSYGATVDGNAVLNRLRAYTISADYVQTGILASTNAQTYFDLTNSEICTVGTEGVKTFKTYFRGGDIEFYGSTSSSTDTLGKTAKMRTGYFTSGSTTTKHFAIGYISNDNSGADGASSLKLGAFKASNDQFIDLLELSGSGGAVFGTSANKINAYLQGGHIETNVLKTSGTVVGSANFSTGLVHYSAHSVSGNTGWRKNIFGAYNDGNNNHWTGWAARDTNDNFLHSFTSIKNGDLVYFRIDNGNTGYISVDTTNNRIALRQSYGGNFSYSNGLDLYCKDIYCNDLTVNGSNVYSNLTNLYGITGTGKVNSETHYATLDRHNTRLSEFWTMLKNTEGRIKVGLYTPSAGGKYSTLLHFQHGSAYYGTIACSSTSNFAFYKGNGTSAELTAIYYSSSTEDIKKNISESKTDAVQLLEHSKIYNYDYKTADEIDNSEKSKKSEEKMSKSSETKVGSNLGFVIGRDTPDEVISDDGTAVNLYSFTSLTWLAAQQLLERIKTLESRISELEEPT